VVWPGKFKPDIISRYNGSSDPIEFLQLNITAIQAARGYWHVMANWFPMAVKGAVRAWLMDLALETITLWKDLCERFTANFSPMEDSFDDEPPLPLANIPL
jgi:hypothetical protein